MMHLKKNMYKEETIKEKSQKNINMKVKENKLMEENMYMLLE